MKPLQEYEIEITKHHLQGNMRDSGDCIGHRAFSEALNNTEYDRLHSITWGYRSGRLFDVKLNCYYAYWSIDKETKKSISMVGLTQEDIGRTILFQLYDKFQP